MNLLPQENDWQTTVSNLAEAFGSPFTVSVVRDVPAEKIKPVVQNVTFGKYRLVIPIGREAGNLAVAVGTLDVHTKDLLDRLLNLAIRYDQQRQTSEERRLDLDAYARHFSREFEELNWLRSQLQRLRHCNPAGSVADFARGVLLPLCGILNAEEIILVSAEGEQTRPGQALPAAGTAVIRVGPGENALDAAGACELVDRLREVAGHHPLVQNDMKRRREFSMAPQVHSCILVPVIMRKAFLGWLLAINHVSKPRDPSASNESALLEEGEDEFGTAEASLLESAAVILAVHPRSAELFGTELPVDSDMPSDH